MGIFSKITALFCGSLIIAVGIDFFLVPFQILDGGIIGLALIINYLFGVKVGLTIILLSSPIFFYTWLNFRDFFYNSVLGMLVSSFFIDILYPYHFYFSYYIRLTPLESSIIGGSLVGIGIGIMLRKEISIGGADMLARIISSFVNINVGVLIMIIDAFVVSIGGMIFSVNIFILSIIAVLAVGITTGLLTLKIKKLI